MDCNNWDCERTRNLVHSLGDEYRRATSEKNEFRRKYYQSLIDNPPKTSWTQFFKSLIDKK